MSVKFVTPQSCAIIKIYGTSHGACILGGAIELVLTGNDWKSSLEKSTFSADAKAESLDSSTAPPYDHHPVSLHMLGYMALFGNTFCTVGIRPYQLLSFSVILFFFTGCESLGSKTIHFQRTRK